MSKKRGHRVSFAVSDYDDGGVRATSPTTLIKTSREDIYIGAQLGMGTFKISLHGGTHGRSEPGSAERVSGEALKVAERD